MARSRVTARSTVRQAILTGTVAFGIAVAMGYGSQTILLRVQPVPAFLTLAGIIFVGVIFDVIGVAVTAATESPFHAMAAKRTPGARHALRLVRNAPRVASFCNDVVGDIAASLAGAAGAAIIFQLVITRPALDLTAGQVLMVAVISALTVGGKAYGKGIAIRQANGITHRVGRILDWVERATGMLLVPEAPARPRVPRAPRSGARVPRGAGARRWTVPDGEARAQDERQRPGHPPRRAPRPRREPRGGRDDGEPHSRPD